MSHSIEGLYPFLILIGVSLLKGLRKRAKEKKEQEKKVFPPAPPLPAQQPKIEPPPPTINVKNVKSVELSEVVRKEVFRQKKKPRIAKLIGGLKSKKDLILLSEILVNKHNIN